MGDASVSSADAASKVARFTFWASVCSIPLAVVYFVVAIAIIPRNADREPSEQSAFWALFVVIAINSIIATVRVITYLREHRKQVASTDDA